MLVLALLGRQRRLIVGLSALTLVQFTFQSVFVALRADYPALAALHPVNGFLHHPRHASLIARLSWAARHEAAPRRAPRPRRSATEAVRCLTGRRSRRCCWSSGPLIGADPGRQPATHAGLVDVARASTSRPSARTGAAGTLLNAGFVLATVGDERRARGSSRSSWDGAGDGRAGAARGRGGVRDRRASCGAPCSRSRARTTPAIADLVAAGAATEPAEALAGRRAGRPVRRVRPRHGRRARRHRARPRRRRRRRPRSSPGSRSSPACSRPCIRW